MRIVMIRGEARPGVEAVSAEPPPGLVAVVGRDGRLRGMAHRMLAGAQEGVRVTTRPRVPDPVLTRLPDDLRRAIESGLELGTAEEVVEAGTTALALLGGLDRVESARVHLVRVRGPAPAGPQGQAEAIMERIRELEGAPEELAALERELRSLRGDDAEITGDVEAATMEWLRERQDAETHLGAYRDRARELKERLQGLAGREDDADCPTCGRPLREHAATVLEALQEEWESVVQDGSWWRRRREQLEGKPAQLQELEGRALRLHAATESLAERVEVARARVRELEEARLKLAERVGGGSDPEEGSSRVPGDVAQAVDRALYRTARTIREAARARLLERMSRILARMTGGRILAAGWPGTSRLDLFGIEGSLHPPVEEDDAAAHLAARIAVAQTVSARAGTPFPPLILAEPFDRMDDAVKVRTVELLRALLGPVFEQILLVTRGEVVEFYPEAFDAILELRRDALAGPSVFRQVPAGLGPLRLQAASADGGAVARPSR
ncbi:MAG TPA: hypothetical protein VK858_11120 [Longimicrobiales bacterium]|nr:hypothetical protein [Longimicrobiales bacterium]